MTQVTPDRQDPIWCAPRFADVIPGVSTTPPPPSADPVEVALAPTIRIRLLGSGLVAIGVLVAVVMVVAAVADLPRAVVSAVVLLAALGVAVLGLLLGVRRWVVRLDEHGYRVRLLRSAAVRSARWTDVLDLQASTVAGNRCLVFRLRDGRTTTIPVDVIEGDPTSFTETVQAHLDRGHGYRRLRTT